MSGLDLDDSRSEVRDWDPQNKGDHEDFEDELERVPSESSTIVHEMMSFKEHLVLVREQCEDPWPSSQDIVIEQPAGGSYNRITAIDTSENRLILRVPRLEWATMLERDVACLQYVRQHSQIPISKIRAGDPSSDNSLQSPYIIQDRLPGINLDRAIRDGLSTKQLCSIARQLGRTMLALHDITHPAPGLIEFSYVNEDGSSVESSVERVIFTKQTTAFEESQTFTVVPFDIKHPYDMEWKEKAAKIDSTPAEKAHILESYGKSTLHFLATRFGRWRADELRRRPESMLDWDFMHRLTDAASQMKRLFCLGENENCLAHLDFAPRNIMVEIDADGEIHLTGILDGDSAVFAPKFVSCAPPWWLWQDENDPLDVQDQDESKSDEEPASEQNRAIKQAFEETVGEEFLNYAYQERFRLARRIFHVAVSGNNSGEHLKKIEAFLEDWSDFFVTDLAELEALLSDTEMDQTDEAQKDSSEG